MATVRDVVPPKGKIAVGTAPPILIEVPPGARQVEFNGDSYIVDSEGYVLLENGVRDRRYAHPLGEGTYRSDEEPAEMPDDARWAHYKGRSYIVDGEGWVLNQRTARRDGRFKFPLGEGPSADQPEAIPFPSDASKVEYNGKAYIVDAEGYVLSSNGRRDKRYASPLGQKRKDTPATRKKAFLSPDDHDWEFVMQGYSPEGVKTVFGETIARFCVIKDRNTDEHFTVSRHEMAKYAGIEPAKDGEQPASAFESAFV